MKKKEKEIKSSSVLFGLWNSHGRMEQYVDEIYRQPSSNQKPHLLSWLEPPNFRGLTSHITFSSLVVEIFFLHCGVSHSSRKVSTCMPFIYFLRHLLSRSDLLKLRQKFSRVLGSIISEAIYRLSTLNMIPLPSTNEYVSAYLKIHIIFLGFAFSESLILLSPTMYFMCWGSTYDLWALFHLECLWSVTTL